MRSLPTRSQQDMALAAERVAEIREKRKSPDSWAGEYKGVCNCFPVMVMTCGLCQAIAFTSAKARSGSESTAGTTDAKAGKLASAHKRVLDDLAIILKCSPEKVAEVSTLEYMRQTRRVLAAWIYLKRFAQAMLPDVQGVDQ